MKKKTLNAQQMPVRLGPTFNVQFRVALSVGRWTLNVERLLS